VFHLGYEEWIASQAPALASAEPASDKIN